jgi:hypothetical protein
MIREIFTLFEIPFHYRYVLTHLIHKPGISNFKNATFNLPQMPRKDIWRVRWFQGGPVREAALEPAVFFSDVFQRQLRGPEGGFFGTRVALFMSYLADRQWLTLFSVVDFGC